ncbi:MAG: DUF4386 domain-containing protein [Anaerolineales bacterium]|jgi:hypothetical protein
MNNQKTRKLAGGLLIAGAILVNIPYASLVMNFNYPDILREPAGNILAQFSAGGTGLVWTWLAFAWVGLPILIGILLIPHALNEEGIEPGHDPLIKLAVFFGAAGAVAQILGLLRWVFVVPVLARIYTSSQAIAAAREAAIVTFQALHQYVGVVLGEHIGQLFTILWMILLSVSLMQRKVKPRWLSWTGFLASAVYLLAQGELITTVIPGFPVWGEAGFIGSMMWLGWILALGVFFIRSARRRVDEHTGKDPRLSPGAVQ